MPFVILRTRSSGASVCVDGPNNLLEYLRSNCRSKEDPQSGARPFKFSWLHHNERYRGGIEGKLENSRMSIRKILNIVEACGWRLLSSHNFGENGSEYVFVEDTTLSKEMMDYPTSPLPSTPSSPLMRNKRQSFNLVFEKNIERVNNRESMLLEAPAYN